MTDDPMLLGALACSVYTAVCLILVVIAIWQNDRINVLEAALGIVERKEYRLENEVLADRMTADVPLPVGTRKPPPNP